MDLGTLDDIAADSRTCNKAALRAHVETLVAELGKAISQLRTKGDRLTAAYDGVVDAARPFTRGYYGGLVGSSNHNDQTRLTVAIQVLEVLKCGC